VPILHSSGTVIAAINVSTTASSHTVESIHDNLLPPLQLAAERISKDLTASRPFSQPKTSGISPS
jgi:IclR family pca regulon transcriptional regulator